LQKIYAAPPSATDRLYQASFQHGVGDDEQLVDCSVSCSGRDPTMEIRRRPREEDENNPEIHYGLIASGNQVIKDAIFRDELAKKKGVLCYETEAAGVLNQVPCLVIRGIWYYTDSH